MQAARLHNLHYLNPTENLGIYDSQSAARLRLLQPPYVQTSLLRRKLPTFRNDRLPLNAKSTIQSDTFLLFYTIYLKPTFSFSFLGGPQHYVISQSPSPGYGSWAA